MYDHVTDSVLNAIYSPNDRLGVELMGANQWNALKRIISAKTVKKLNERNGGNRSKFLNNVVRATNAARSNDYTAAGMMKRARRARSQVMNDPLCAELWGVNEEFSNELMSEKDKGLLEKAFFEHDLETMKNITNKYTKVRDNRLFDEIYPGPIWIAEKILLSHERIELPFAFNIYGHHHGDVINNDHLMCLCAEHIDYTPVSLVKLFKNGAFSKVESIHRITIDRAADRKKRKEKEQEGDQ